MATQTANKKYKYSEVFHGLSLDTWVQEVNRLNCIANKWKVNPLKPSGFGYDNLAVCIGNLFNTTKIDDIVHTNIEKLADIIHKGWIINYTYWRDNTPWVENKEYTKPANPLGDERRNNCAITEYKDLPEDEKNKDRDIVKFILMISDRKNVSDGGPKLNHCT